MPVRSCRYTLLFFAHLLFLTAGFHVSAAQNGIFECTLDESQISDRMGEHLWGGAPDDSEVHVRNAFVFAWNEQYRVPRWAAWHARQDFLDTPAFTSRWAVFQRDTAITDTSHNDYLGWDDPEYNLVRGRLVPYAISGGDRDNDGMDAEIESDLSVEDQDDACTVFEINSYSNVAPRYGERFSSPAGQWWFLETLVRNLLENGRDLQIYAGTVFVGNERIQLIGNRRGRQSFNWSIGVPHGYFKIVIDASSLEAVGFLFDHAADLAAGCSIDDQSVTAPSDCIVPIDQIEAITGLHFFNELSPLETTSLRNSSTADTWENWLNAD